MSEKRSANDQKAAAYRDFDEEAQLGHNAEPTSSAVRRRLIASGIHVLLFLAIWKGFMHLFRPSHPTASSAVFPFSKLVNHEDAYASICPQYDALKPPAYDELDANVELLKTPQWRKDSARRLSGAVQVETQSFDDLGQVGEDERFNKLFKFEKYLEDTFPLIHEKLEKTNINTHGLLFKWQGSDPSLKPILLMAHYDTVPVLTDTLDQWTYEPWSGTYDGTYVWGRGAADCKTLLIAELEAVTLLLGTSFTPKRSIYIQFGFDEEVGGLRGAGNIGKYLEETLGKDSFELVIDEGGLPLMEFYGSNFVLPASGEKGSITVNVTLSTKGGHSSVPPPHTGIGIISKVVTTLEANPFESNLTIDNPYFSMLQCAATQSKDMPDSLREKVLRAADDDELRQQVAKLGALDRRSEMLYTTSQAVDIIKGGVKVNALPEFVYTVVNHRIRPGSTGEDVKDHYVNVLSPLAQEFNLDLNAFGQWYNFSTTSQNGGQLNFVAPRYLNPAPVSPTADPSNEVWKKLVGTIKHIYDEPEKPAVVAPSIMTGNTDTRFMWNLSKNIYRFGPARSNGEGGAHTVDEFASIDDHIESTKFFHELIRNFD
ncbi:putative carboxypeptidase [Atractiella rhizophila]|nr:putative carboxypeptidase [Atractiella rhizophila]